MMNNVSKFIIKTGSHLALVGSCLTCLTLIPALGLQVNFIYKNRRPARAPYFAYTNLFLKYCIKYYLS